VDVAPNREAIRPGGKYALCINAGIFPDANPLRSEELRMTADAQIAPHKREADRGDLVWVQEIRVHAAS
jgi:hypothetical protein